MDEIDELLLCMFKSLFMEIYHMWIKVNFTNDNVNIDEMDMDEWGWKNYHMTNDNIDVDKNHIEWNRPNEINCNTMCENNMLWSKWQSFKCMPLFKCIMHT
jgi:hypothetical protein